MAMNVLKNKKGETLTSLLIAAGLSSVVMLASVELLRQQKIQENTQQQEIEANLFESDVQRFLNPSTICLENFPPGTVDPDNDPSNVSLPLNQKLNQLISGGAADPRFVPGRVLANGKLRVPAAGAFQLLDAPNIGPNSLGQVKLRVTLERTGNFYGAGAISRDIDVAVRTDQTGMITYCSTVAGEMPLDCQNISGGSPLACPPGYSLFSGSFRDGGHEQNTDLTAGPQTITSTDPITKVTTSYEAWVCGTSGKGGGFTCYALCCRE